MFFTNSQIGICSKKFYAQFLGIHRFTTLPSQPALLCRFAELMIWRGETFHHTAARLNHPGLLKSHHRGRWSAALWMMIFWRKSLFNSSYRSLFDPISILCQEHLLSCWNNDHKCSLGAGFNTLLPSQMCRHTQALHTYRINLSPFTKDFRVWGAPIET